MTCHSRSLAGFGLNTFYLNLDLSKNPEKVDIKSKIIQLYCLLLCDILFDILCIFKIINVKNLLSIRRGSTQDQFAKDYIKELMYPKRLGSSAMRDTVGQFSSDRNSRVISFARLEAQTLIVQSVPP